MCGHLTDLLPCPEIGVLVIDVKFDYVDLIHV